MGVDYGVQLLLLEFFDSVLVVSQVQLGAHQDYGRVGAVVSHLRVPLWVKRTVRSGSIQLSNTEEECGVDSGLNIALMSAIEQKTISDPTSNHL